MCAILNDTTGEILRIIILTDKEIIYYYLSGFILLFFIPFSYEVCARSKNQSLKYQMFTLLGCTGIRNLVLSIF